jgi:hypothetical protein
VQLQASTTNTGTATITLTYTADGSSGTDTHNVDVADVNFAKPNAGDACSGFDDSGTAPYWLMVPVNQAGGTQTASFMVNFGKPGLDVELYSDPAGAVAFSGGNPTLEVNATGTVVSVTGMQANPTAAIKVRDFKTKTDLKGSLNLDIKGSGTRNLVLFAVSQQGPNDKKPKLVPKNAPNGLSNLDAIYGRQANYHITASGSTSLAVNYDLNGDGKLAAGGEDSAVTSEMDAITGAIVVYYCNPTCSANFDSQALYGVYVKALSSPTTVGAAPVTGADYFIGDTHADPTPVISAHELGHLLGLQDVCTGQPGDSPNCSPMVGSDTNRIMWHIDGSNPQRCRLVHADWDTVNPN